MLLNRTRTALVVLVALAGASPEALAGRLGPEFRVNTFTRDTQDIPSVAGLSDGGFVVTWTSEQQVGPYSADIYGQRYTHEGKGVGSAFRVNTYARGVQYSSVAGLRPDEGDFVVTWTSFRQDGFGDAIYGQRYDAAGRKIGGEFRINTHTAYDQEHSSVAKLSNGGFVVTWGDSGRGCYGQLYSAAGAKVGNEFRVGPGGRTSVAGLRDGGFVVTRTGDDGSLEGVFGQRYNAAGGTVGGEFRINTHTLFRQLNPSIAGLGDGGFVVIWTSQDGQDGSGSGVYGQRYSHEGKKVGTEFRVNSHTVGHQGYNSSIAALSNGGFVATWDSDGQDGSRTGVYGQLYGP